MPKAKFDLPEIPAAAQKPIYAGVGAGDIAYAAVKEYVSDVQKKISVAQKSVVEFQPMKAGQQAVAAVETRVVDLRDEALSLPNKVQKVVDDNVATATSTYADLAKRGETLVTKIRKAQPAVAVEIKTTKTKPVTVKAAATKVAPKTTTAKKTTATKAPTAKRAPAKKAPATKAPAAKKSPATKAPAAKKA